MASTNNLRPINDIIAKIRAEAERDIVNNAKYLREAAERKIARVETNRRALALLDGAGFDLDLPEWHSGSNYTLDLGFFPNTRAGHRALAEKVRAVRLALDCRLAPGGKQVDDAKKGTVTFTLDPVDFPGIEVAYTRRLPRSAKCKIVRERRTVTTLVCEA